jgi:hypothetical protein
MRRPSDPHGDDKARKAGGPSRRDERLKAALKANMARRKAQAKAQANLRAAEDAAGDNEKD